MAIWGWLSATLLFGLVTGYVACKVVTYYKNKAGK